jgi:transposase
VNIEAKAPYFPKASTTTSAIPIVVRVVVAFVDELDLVNLGFEGAIPADTGRPAYHPAILLKIYIYGYLNRIQSSRRLEREVQRNVELMWLTGRLVPDFTTIANFRKDNSKAIRGVRRQFVVLCQQMGLFGGIGT